MSNSIANNESALTSYYKDIVNQQEKAAKEKTQLLEENHSKALDRLATMHQQEAEKANTLLKETVNDITEKHAQKIKEEKDAFMREVEHQKNYSYNNRGQMPMVSEKTHQEHLKEIQKAYEQRRKMDIDAMQNFEEEKKGNIKKIEDHAKEKIVRLNNQFKQGVSDLQDEIRLKEKIARNTVLEKEAEKNETLAKNESEKKKILENLNASFELELHKLREALDEKTAYYEARQKSALQGQGDTFETMVKKQKEEQAEIVKDVKNMHDKAIDALQANAVHDKMLLNKQLSQQQEQAQQAKEMALKQQENAHALSLAHVKKNMEQERKKLEEGSEKVKKNALVDVSAELEQKMRTAIMQEYEKAFQAELKRNKEKMENFTENVKEPLLDLKRKSEEKEARLISAASVEQFASKSQMIDVLNDAEVSAAQKLKDQEVVSDRQRNYLVKYFERAMERQKHDFTNMIQDLQVRSDQRILDLQKDHEFSTKEARRGFAEQQNDLIRENERKLSEQKIAFEDQLDQLRLKSFDDFKDLERKDKQELENTIKSYEQKILQLEAQFKEREKVVYQSFQDEMDRTKRSYELLRKKS